LGRSVEQVKLKHLKFGVHADGGELYRIPKMERIRAHVLFIFRQCRINHVADVANATGLRPQGGFRKSRKIFSARQ